MTYCWRALKLASSQWHVVIIAIVCLLVTSGARLLLPE
jgi:hypothetical protein